LRFSQIITPHSLLRTVDFRLYSITPKQRKNMFSLLITVIAIALVTALALVTIYYGGSAARGGHDKAAAASIVAQAEQISAAGLIASTQGASWPAGAGPAFAEPFLKAMPVPPARAYVAGAPAATDWTYYLPGPPARIANPFVLKDKITKDVCLEVNRIAQFSGIPAAWDGQSTIQCFGVGPSYTFLYSPSGVTNGQTQAALAQSVGAGTLVLGAAPLANYLQDSKTSAMAPAASVATPGYPRLCPSGRVIPAGYCQGGGLGNGVTPPEEPEAPEAPSGVTFVSDSFTGPNGTLIMNHSPEIGGAWVRPYQVMTGQSDCNWHIVNGALEPDDWPCDIQSQSALNQATPPSADYDVSATFTFKRDDSYIELYLLGRASVNDAMAGYLYLHKSGDSTAQIAAYSEGNVGYQDVSIPLTVGTHTVRFSMKGTDFKLYYDGVLIHQRSTSAIMAPGFAGYSFRHNDDLDYMSIDNFLAK
jgi:hypothetical protein